ncbi:NADP-dependent oxidoreductase domain-containing protein [Obelidium mucronatum]|nr:NADP-dependent oxidoreductase domain-containing protein [Obelidium mucronatum]
MTIDNTLITLNNGIQIPKLAYGTGTKWNKNGPKISCNNILSALRAGFTHIDTAEGYGTEAEVGLAVAQFLKETGKPRSSLFITTKIRPPPKDVTGSISAQLKRLGPAIEYVDLYLIHAPFWDYTTSHPTLKQVWSELEHLVLETKQVRADWYFKAIQQLNPKIQPAVNQIEFHAYFQNPKLHRFLENELKTGVVTAAYGPLQPLIAFSESGSVKAIVDRIAATKGTNVSGTQVLLAWGWARGIIQVTTSSKEERLKEAVAALEISLSQEEVEEITKAGEVLNLKKYITNQQFDD